MSDFKWDQWIARNLMGSNVITDQERAEVTAFLVKQQAVAKNPWTPTVPHPLLQIDEELKAYGAADE